MAYTLKTNSWLFAISLFLAVFASILFLQKPDLFGWLFLWLIFLIYVLAIVFFLIGWFQSQEKQDNYLKYWDKTHRYYSAVGYSLFTGGLINLFTGDFSNPYSLGISLAILFVGVLSFVYGERAKDKLDEFTEKYTK
jgi:ABC-type sulfate transport system permease component